MLKKNLFGDTEAYLIFDDTVINKKYGYNPHSELPACSTERYMNYHYYFEPTN